MYRVLTKKEKIIFTTNLGIYEITVHYKTDGKAHVKIIEFSDHFDNLEVPNKYGQFKTIAEKEKGYYEIIEEFYPKLLTPEHESEEE